MIRQVGYDQIGGSDLIDGCHNWRKWFLVRLEGVILLSACCLSVGSFSLKVGGIEKCSFSSGSVQ